MGDVLSKEEEGGRKEGDLRRRKTKRAGETHEMHGAKRKKNS